MDVLHFTPAPFTHPTGEPLSTGDTLRALERRKWLAARTTMVDGVLRWTNGGPVGKYQFDIAYLTCSAEQQAAFDAHATLTAGELAAALDF
jgi:hypothetical protein